MKSKINIAVIASIMIFVLGCNLFSGENGGDNENANVNAENANAGNEEVPANANEQSSAPAESTSRSRSVRVRFAKGKSSRSYESSLSERSTHTYFLRASKGQDMTVSISSQSNNALFEVRDPGGKKISGGTVGDTNFAQKLPATGNYKIIVSGTRGDAKYKIDFNVKAAPATPQPSPPAANTGNVNAKPAGNSANPKPAANSTNGNI